MAGAVPILQPLSCVVVALILLASGAQSQLLETFTWRGRLWAKQPSFVPSPNLQCSFNPAGVTYNAADDSVTISIFQSGGVWYGSGIFTARFIFPPFADRDNLTFGDYQTWVEAPLTTMDPNAVFGQENLGYPTDGSPQGAKAKNDLKHSRLGRTDPTQPPALYTVFPPGPSGTALPWIQLQPMYYFLAAPFRTTHRIRWRSTSVTFQSLLGFKEPNDNTGQIASWTFYGNTTTITQGGAPFFFLTYTNSGATGPFDGQRVDFKLVDWRYTPTNVPVA
eukprot:jgi/Botrbrau1/8238/Bobra.0392s0033.1